ncbi:unnamed protein product [Leuciscus chuanchicus]
MTRSAQTTTPAALNVSAVKNASAVSGARATAWLALQSGCYTSCLCLLISLLSVSAPPAIRLSTSTQKGLEEKLGPRVNMSGREKDPGPVDLQSSHSVLPSLRDL